MAGSTLIALLVLALVQVALAVPTGVYAIINKAVNGALKAESTGALTVEPGRLHSSPWVIYTASRGSIIRPQDGEDYITAEGGEALLTPYPTEWYFEPAGKEIYKIKFPSEDKVLTWDKDAREVKVQGSRGTSEQLWQVQSLRNYGRMFRQC